MQMLDMTSLLTQKHHRIREVPGAQRGEFMELLLSVWGCSVFSCWLHSLASVSTVRPSHIQDHNSVRSSAEDFSIIKANLTERLQASNNKLSSMSEERDLLNANLTEITKELNRLQTLSTRKRSCPAGWNAFRCSCYLLSTESGSWTRAREDCKNREADLVVIDSIEEQKFLSKLYTKQSWIGLTDSETEGTWKWIDGTPVTLMYWDQTQPDNGGGHPKWGEEDCVQIQAGMKTENNWNDLSCHTSMQWICEREA